MTRAAAAESPRGRFAEGIGANPPGARLPTSLERSVFPAEGLCESAAQAHDVIAAFLVDTRAQGVVGGAASMTDHAAATRVALEMLPDTLSVGLVLMQRHCPEYLRKPEEALWRAAPPPSASTPRGQLRPCHAACS